MTVKVIKGSLWTLIGQVMPLGFSLLATPFTIRLLGAEGYGVLIFVGLIPSYLGFADLGMGISSTRFASAAYASGDREKEAQIVRTAGLITLLASLPFAIALFLLSAPITQIFRIPDHYTADATIALKLASITFVIGLLAGIFNTPQLTRLRMDLNTLVISSFRVAGLIATPIILYVGGGIVGIVIALMVANFLTLASHLYLSSRLLPTLWGSSLDRGMVKPLIRFGGPLAFATIASVILLNAEKGILPTVISVEALAYYSVAYTLASMISLFTASMMQSLLPAFSQLQNNQDKEALDNLYSRGIRVNTAITIPMLVVIALLANPFFTVWAGEEFGRESSGPLYILLVGLAFNLQSYLPGTAILASGRSDIFTKIYWFELVPYLFLLWGLANYAGVAGVAIAWSIRISIDAIIYFLVAKRVTNVQYRGPSLSYFVGPSLLLVLPLLMNIYIGKLDLAVVVTAAISLSFYSLIVWKTIIPHDEIQWFNLRVDLWKKRIRSKIKTS